MAIYQHKLTFELNRNNKIIDKKKAYQLYVRLRIGRTLNFYGATGIKIKTTDWNKDLQRVRNKAHINNKDAINNLLIQIEQYFDKAIIEFKSQRTIPTYKEVKQLYNNFIIPIDNTKIYFLDYYRSFIEDAKTKPNPTTKKLLAPRTIVSYRTSLRLLERFEVSNYKLTFDNVDLAFYYDFINYCELNNYARNSIGNQIKNIKAVLNKAETLELTKNTDFKRKEFSKPKEQNDSIYLSNSELLKLFHLD